MARASSTTTISACSIYVFSRLIAEIGGRRRAPNCRTGWRRSRNGAGRSGTAARARRRYRGGWTRCSHSRGSSPTPISSPSPETQSEAHLLAIAGRGRHRGGGHRRAGPPRRPRRRSPVARQSRRAPVGTRASSRSSSGPKSDSVLAEKVGLRPDIPAVAVPRPPARGHRRLVQQRLLASATPGDAGGDPTPSLAKVSQPTVRESAPRATIRRRSARSSACAGGGKLDEAALSSNSPSKGNMRETVAAVASLCAVPTAVVDRLMGGERPDPVLILVQIGRLVWATVAAILSVAAGRSEHIEPRPRRRPRRFRSPVAPATAQRVGAVLADAIGRRHKCGRRTR